MSRKVRQLVTGIFTAATILSAMPALAVHAENTTAVEIQELVTDVKAANNIYGGTDYSLVFDAAYYAAHNADVVAACGDTNTALLNHFVKYGMKEGRQGNASFDVISYRYRYADLRNVYGKNLPDYYLHYIRYGAAEGREATGTTTLQNGTTVYNGVNYAAVYNYNYYIEHYPDIKNAFGNDDEAVIAHFVNYGMRERRQGSASFDVNSYRNQYRDLRNAFGGNYPAYYLHYIQNGKAEGRKATGVTELQNGITQYNGVDYAAVYDYSYYTSHYADIKAVFGNDELAVLLHFINYGMQEGRQAKADFNVNIYRGNYGDLANAYGSDLKAYYVHYILHGKAEGRTAATVVTPTPPDDSTDTPTTDLHSIMGTNTTTVAQMVNFYNARSSIAYPAYYQGTDASTIEQLCQIYLEECAAEGVDAAIAFCQAMNETGYLKFGGQVQITQNNLAGLGALDGGAAGASFASVRLGVRAQIQHLKAYGSTDALNQECVDPRYRYVTRGSSIYVEWLGIPDNPNGKGWASRAGYGYNIYNLVKVLYTY